MFLSSRTSQSLPCSDDAYWTELWAVVRRLSPAEYLSIWPRAIAWMLWFICSNWTGFIPRCTRPRIYADFSNDNPICSELERSVSHGSLGGSEAHMDTWWWWAFSYMRCQPTTYSAIFSTSAGIVNLLRLFIMFRFWNGNYTASSFEHICSKNPLVLFELPYKGTFKDSHYFAWQGNVSVSVTKNGHSVAHPFRHPFCILQHWWFVCWSCGHSYASHIGFYTLPSMHMRG